MALLEYCNLPTGTAWADQRAANGHPEPYRVKVWCLGNELDGPWQAGHVLAGEYARRAQQAGKIMKGLDPSIALVVCGSSKRAMPTYLQWDREVLEYCWEEVDYISAHRYTYNFQNDSAWFLSEGVEVDRILEDYAGLLRYVRGVKRSNKQVHLAFDEWNVWDRNKAPITSASTPWQRAPHLLEQTYNLEDALVCAQFLNSFLRHADIVKIACIAQVVNVIAPILTRTDGLLIQSIYYPFVWMAEHAQGRSLTPIVASPMYSAGDRGHVPVLDVAASHDPETHQVGVFMVNRSLQEDITVRIQMADTNITRVLSVDVLAGNDPKLENSWEHPKVLAPVRGHAPISTEGDLTVVIPRLGFITLKVRVEKR
jgi:alpha-N-arabinofuranosidase